MASWLMGQTNSLGTTSVPPLARLGLFGITVDGKRGQLKMEKAKQTER
jgi:hypothetical protein